MALCPKCSKQCPDDAAHCGFCGGALPALVPKKTMFGYAAMMPAGQAPAAKPAAPAAPRGGAQVAGTRLGMPAPDVRPARQAAPAEPAVVVAPQTSAPQTSAPQTSAPQTSAPQTSAPQTSAPQTSAPQTAAPQPRPARVTTRPSDDPLARTQFAELSTPAARPEDAVAKTQWADPQAQGPARAAPQAQGPARAAPQAQGPARAAPQAQRPLSQSMMQQGMPAPASLRRSQPHAAQPREPEIPATMFAPSQPAPQPSQPAHAREDPQFGRGDAAHAERQSALHHGASEGGEQGKFPATMFAPATTPGQAPVAVPATQFAPAAPAAAEVPATRLAAAATPRPDASRPVLASESLAADLAPQEPARGAMRALMAIGGVLLIGLFVAPWGEVAGKLIFSWDLLKSLSGVLFAKRIYLAAAGVVFLAAALLPLPYLLRALIGLVLGLIPFVLDAINVPEWRLILLFGSLILLPAALLHRARYRGSVLSRILVGVGVLGILACLLVPEGGSVPLIKVFDGLGDAPASTIVLRLFPLLLLLLALLSLLAFLGSGSTGLARIWAVGLLLFLPLQMWLSTAFQLGSGKAATHLIPDFYGGLTLLAALVLSAFGLSQLFAAGQPHR